MSLTRGSPNLLDLTSATGAVVCDEENCASVGHTPPMNEVRELVLWLRAQDSDVFHTTMLAKHYPPAAAWSSFASGLLAISLSARRPYYVLWFRPERRQTIRWAGNPNKPARVRRSAGGAPRLSPRGSFAAWEEEQRGTSAPWESIALDAAADLRRTLLDQVLARAEEMASLNAELADANRQLEDSAVEMKRRPMRCCATARSARSCSRASVSRATRRSAPIARSSSSSR